MSLFNKMSQEAKSAEMNSQLLAFLCCTTRKKKPIGKLRGMDHILRIIWVMVCEEWWQLHVQQFPRTCIEVGLKLPEITHPWQRPLGQRRVSSDPDSYMDYPKVRQQCAGCPVAVVAKQLQFPVISSIPPNTFQHQETEDLYVNMMPFDVFRIQTLPECCKQYWPMIEKCRKLSSPYCQTGYLTIDERPAPAGASQRRRGLHVESPGLLPLFRGSDYDDEVSVPATGNRFVPGAEHRWGGGLMMRSERVRGGIFMASNVANTTAVWNCHIRDNDGDFIGPHGDIERFRELLGPCARTLDAGELIWMTDRTPHESLPVPVQPDGTPVRRQYFRLVIGTVTAWYADHSTPNPTGYLPLSSVRIVHGDKFAKYLAKRVSWNCGTTESLQAARKLQRFSDLLYEYGLGHLYERFQQYGVRSIADLLRVHAAQVREALGEDSSDEEHSEHSDWNDESEGEEADQGPLYNVLWNGEHSADGEALFFDESGEGASYYELPRITLMVRKAKAMHTLK